MEEKRTRGKPKKWKSGEELVKNWDEYCTYIVENNFPVVPTFTDFANWLEKHGMVVDRRTIYLSTNEYYPEVKNDIDKMRADVMVQGAAMGKYPSTTMCIFALKNWCGWTDKQDVKSDNNTKIEIVLPEAVDQYAD